MRSTVHQNTATKQSNGTTSAVWNKQEVDSEQEHKEALQLGKPFSQPSATGSADDKPTSPTPVSIDFSKLPIFPPQQVRIQPKLKFNAPGDKYEHEADRVAEHVMRMPAPQIQRKPQWGPPTLPHPVSIQRIGEAYAKEEDETLQEKSAGNTGVMVPLVIAQQIQSTRGNGQMMDMGTRSFMEARFGADFGGVRIHADNNSALFNQRLQARAFTLGNDIYFNQGQYSPRDGDARRLLAHELTHTIQQGSGSGVIIQRQAQAPKPVKKPYPIRVPAGTTSWGQFRRYVEVRIFGEVKNINWTQTGSGVAASEAYKDIQKYIGKTITFHITYSAPQSASEDKKAQDEAYSILDTTEKESINQEIDARYFESEGSENGSQIKSNETGKIAIWHSFKRQVMADKEKLGNLPPAVKEFLHSNQTFTPENYAQLTKIADLLNQFNTADFIDYKSKVNFETTDLEALGESIQRYLNKKHERQAEAEKRETIKTKLYGLEALYEQYTTYISHTKLVPGDAWAAQAMLEIQNQLPQEKLALEENLIANGFENIEQFRDYITDYESAFEKATIAIAEDQLLQYRHQLFEEEKKINSDAYITALFSQLSSSGAKEHFEAADSKEAIANGILRDPLGGYARGDIELKTGLRSEASSARAAGNASISALPSSLVKEEGFDRESLSSVDSKEELKSTLLSYIEGKKTSITETWEDIHNPEKPNAIYEIRELIDASIKAQGIEKNSIFFLIIDAKRDKFKDAKILKAISLTILAIALTIVTLGATTPLIVIGAGVASAGLSIYGVYEAIEDYKRDNTYHDVGLLTEEPSLAWVILSIAGAAIDVGALYSVLKAAEPISKAAIAFNDGGGLPRLKRELDAITDISEQVRKNITDAAEARLKAGEALKSISQSGGTAKMVILPGGEEFSKLVVAAYYIVKKGILDFHSFLLELKAAKIIDEAIELTAEEQRILKLAFEKGKSLAKADAHLASEIEKTVADGNFLKLEKLLEAGGDSISLFQNIKLGRLIGSGGNKEVFEVVGNSDIVIAILKRGKPQELMEKEIAFLNTLSENKLSIVEVFEQGIYDGRVAIIMKRYEQGSKEIVRLVGKKVEIVGSSKLLNEKSISDLEKIMKIMIDEKIKIDDLQFLISKDGGIVIADPLNIVVGQLPSANNLRMIKLLIEAAYK